MASSAPSVRTVLHAHEAEVNVVAHSPCGRFFATGADKVIVWGVVDNLEYVRFDGAADDTIHDIVWRGDGRYLATAGSDGTAVVWDMNKCAEVTTIVSPVERTGLSGKVAAMTAVAFSPDGLRLVTCSSDGTAHYWTLPTSKGPATLITTLRGHTGALTSVAFSPDGTHILTGSRDETAIVWSARHAHVVTTLTGHVNDVTSVVYSPDGKNIVLGSNDSSCSVWDARTFARTCTLEGKSSNSHVRALAFSPDSSRLVASAGAQSTAIVWDFSRSPINPIATLRFHSAAVNGVSFAPDGNSIATASSDHTVVLWRSAFFTPRRVALALLCADAPPDAKPSGARVVLPGVVSSAFSADGRLFAGALRDGTTRVYASGGSGAQAQWAAPTLRGVLAAETSVAVHGVAFCPLPRAHLLVTAASDAAVRVWSTDTLLQAALLEGHSGSVNAVAFAPGGRRFATVSDDHTAIIWGPPAGGDTAAKGEGAFELRATLQGHNDKVHSVAWFVDGARIATASAHTVIIWDVETGSEIGRLAPPREDGAASANHTHKAALHARRVSSSVARVVDPFVDLSVSPSGTLIATASHRAIRIWSAENFTEVKTMRSSMPANVMSVRFSPSISAARLVVGKSDGSAIVWETLRFTKLCTVSGHHAAVELAHFSPDGVYIATASDDGVVAIWPHLPSVGVVHGSKTWNVTPESALFFTHGFADNSRAALGLGQRSELDTPAYAAAAAAAAGRGAQAGAAQQVSGEGGADGAVEMTSVPPPGPGPTKDADAATVEEAVLATNTPKEAHEVMSSEGMHDSVDLEAHYSTSLLHALAKGFEERSCLASGLGGQREQQTDDFSGMSTTQMWCDAQRYNDMMHLWTVSQAKYLPVRNTAGATALAVAVSKQNFSFVDALFARKGMS